MTCHVSILTPFEGKLIFSYLFLETVNFCTWNVNWVKKWSRDDSLAVVDTFLNILKVVHIFGIQEASNIEEYKKYWSPDFYTLSAPKTTLAKYTELKFLVHKKMFQPYPDEANACQIIVGARAIRCIILVSF